MALALDHLRPFLGRTNKPDGEPSEEKHITAPSSPRFFAFFAMLALSLFIMSALSNTVSAADGEGLNIGGDPILVYILIVVAIVCLVLWKLTEEELTLYAFVGCMVGAVVVYYVH